MTRDMASDLPPSKLQLLQGGALLAEAPLVERQEWVLGSGEAADLRVQHPTVDPAHARVFLSEGEVFVEDLGSRSGTFVRGRRVQAPVKLSHRDQVLLGQHYVVKPLLVRYFDAAAHVLEDLGLVARPPGAADPRPARGSEDGAEPPEGPGASAPALPQVSGLRERRLPRYWKPAALLLAGVLAVVLLLALLRPSAARWGSVQVSPMTVSAGDELVLRSPDIRPLRGLQIHVGGQLAEVVESRRGWLRIRVPGLSDRPAGQYDVSLVVRHDKLEAYQLMLRYLVRPRIEAASPSPARVGDRVVIRGTGLADDPEDVRVLFGDVAAPILATAPGEMVVRVPVLTRTQPVRVDIEVQVGEARAALPEPLEVGPREPRPLDFRFSASQTQSRDGWEVSTVLGPAFNLPPPRPAEESGDLHGDGDETVVGDAQDRAGAPDVEAVPAQAPVEPPPPILRIVANWERVVERARADPELRISTQPTGGDGCRLTAISGRQSLGLDLGSWEGESEVAVVAPERDELSVQMVCDWFAGVWNRFLQVFARGEPIETGGPLAEYAEVLNRLIQMNRAAGGDGRPEDEEVELLEPLERESLRRAFLPVPEDLGSIAGRWRIELENVFSPDRPHHHVVDLALEQRAGRLSGQASFALVNDGIEVGFGTRPVSGEIILGAPTQVRLRSSLAPPIGALSLDGTLEAGLLGGRFAASDGRTGSWRATRR